MKDLIQKILSKAGHSGIKAPETLIDITQIIDHNRVITYVAEFKKRGSVLANSVLKNGEYEFRTAEGEPPAVEELHLLKDKTLRLCTSLINYAKTPYTQYRRQLEAVRDLHSTEERTDRFLKQNGEAITNDVSEAEEPVLNIPTLEAQRTRAKHKKEESAAKKEQISKTVYDGFPPQKTYIHGWLYWLIAAFILPTETMLNAGALDSIESDLQSWFILPTALTITLMIAGTGHFLGSFIANKSHKGLIISALSTALIMLGIVFFLRANGIQSAFILTFINLAAFIFMTALSYFRHKDESYFVADEATLLYAEKEEEFATEVERIKKTSKDKVAAVYERWNAKALEAIEADLEPLSLEILRLKREEETFDNYLKTQVLDPIDAMYQEYVTQTQMNFVKARTRNNLSVPATSIFKKEPSPGSNGMCSIAIAICFFLFSSCTSEEPVRHINIAVIGDASIEQKDSVALPSAEQQLAFIFKRTDFTPYHKPLEVTRDQIQFEVTHIGETSFVPVQLIELPEGEPIWNMVKSKRRTIQKDFIEKARVAVEIQTRPKGLESTRVVDCFCQVLPPLARSDADLKTVLIISDLLEYSDTENFYTLSKRLPDAHDEIAQRLEKRCPALKDLPLSGIHFYAVYLPDKERDRSTRAARAFWRKYIEDKGGKIDFLPNLPNINTASVAIHQ